MTFDESCEVFAHGKVEAFDLASGSIIEAAKSGAEFGTSEVVRLARALAGSGATVSVPAELHPLADVPSTGGPASLTTLLCPLLVASLGVRVPQLSATGSIAGAVDTMAVITGFRAQLTAEQFVSALKDAGIAHAEPEGSLCPADKTLIEHRRKNKLMEHGGLAASSLLGKKLAVPGTAASFDFRVGPTGNIGADVPAATRTAELFYQAAAELGVKIAITLTDNRTFPCSALGRLESLELLWRVLSGKGELMRLDREHVETCITVAARAFLLVSKDQIEIAQVRSKLRELIRSGEVAKLLVRHLEAQGSDLSSFHGAIAARGKYAIKTICAKRSGPWRSPELAAAKDFVRDGQAAAKRIGLPPLAGQFGLRLLVSPGDDVVGGQPVVQVSHPPAVEVPAALEFTETSISDRFEPVPI